MLLNDCRILVVEDEYFLALDLCQELEEAGAVVVGPEPNVARALSRISSGERIDVAVLDINLGGETAFPIAEALKARRTPFVFASGYSDVDISARFPGAVALSKPLNISALLSKLKAAIRAA